MNQQQELSFFNLGYRMPAEFEKHEACWLIWPQRTDVWRNGAKPVQKSFVALVEAISRSEIVYVGVSDEQYENARSQLPNNIRLVELSNNDCWVRDTGPTFVINEKGRRIGLDWDFNAWGGLSGGLYFPWDKDQRVAKKICAIHGDSVLKVPLILEGGSIHVDGEGRLITTEECLLNLNRNPNLSKIEIEKILSNYLGIKKIIWIKNGTINDETNGHVDNLACFIRPGEIALHWCDDPEDPQYLVSQEAFEILSNSTDAKGRNFIIHKLPHPGPLFISEHETEGIDSSINAASRKEGERMAGSYVNFYIGNSVVVFPLLDPSKDFLAHKLLEKVFPKHDVIGIHAREILIGGGNIHCITQQVPARLGTE